MPQGNTKEQQIDWVAKHTLSDRDMRQLIQEKIERARLLQQANENRKLQEFA